MITLDTDGIVNIYSNSNTPSSGSINITTEKVADDILIVGARGLSVKNKFFNGYIAEIIVFDRDLKPTEIAMVNKYLSKKYNITLS